LLTEHPERHLQSEQQQRKETKTQMNTKTRKFNNLNNNNIGESKVVSVLT
jgi:hypothetical protein